MELQSSLAEVWHWIFKIWNLKLFSSGDNDIQLNQIIIAILTIYIGIYLSKRLTRIIGDRLENIGKIDHNTAFILQKAASYLLFVIVVLIAMPIAGIPITIFTVLGGALAIGVGFGAQNLFNNLISGIILMIERPIRIGDIIEHSGMEGKIADIGNRCVRIRRSDGIDVLLPNSYFLEQEVINWTLHDSDIRGGVNVGVAYGSDTQMVKFLMEKAVKEHPQVHQHLEILVLFEDFGDNSLLFTVLFWTRVNRPMDLRRIQSDIRFELDRSFREAGIVVAFPQRDIHIDTLSPLEVRIKQ
jgi:small-conductance mechanosensitive channel